MLRSFATAFLLSFLPTFVNASCDIELIGKWQQTHARMSTNEAWELFDMGSWTFQDNGQVIVMFDLEHAYTCDANVIEISTPLPTKIEVVDSKNDRMEWKLNDGNFGYTVVKRH